MDKDILQELTAYLESLHHIEVQDIPDLDLYMDQVTAFMDVHLAPIKRYEEDKALTKTMINNYAKNRLLPPPAKKRYSRNHLLILLFIYYYKGILSLHDIAAVLGPLNEKYFNDAQSGSVKLSDIYSEIFSLTGSEMPKLIEDITQKFHIAQETFLPGNAENAGNPAFEALSEEAREELQLFSFLSMLGFDVYLKRQLMEKIVDRLKSRGAEKAPPAKSRRKDGRKGGDNQPPSS